MAIIESERVQELLQHYEGMAIADFIRQWCKDLERPTQEITELCIEPDFKPRPSEKGREWVGVEPLGTAWIHLTFSSKECFKRYVHLSTFEEVLDEQPAPMPGQ
jgi:hypothetical protein